jgi:hypothetical protein
MPSIFISYSHDPADPTHAERVAGLAATLLRDGLNKVFFDQNRGDEEQGLPWPIWMEDRILEADHVLLVCTELYLKKVRHQVAEDEGQGACWEAGSHRRAALPSEAEHDQVPPRTVLACG